MNKEHGIFIHNFEIKHIENETEKIVAKALNQLLAERDDLCKCQVCVEDMFLYALTLLPALYRHQATLRLVMHSPRISQKQIDGAIDKAIGEVLAHPKHT